MSGQYKLSKLEGKVVAIDGPAGSGKSTTAKLLAEKLGFTYLDTGAMYRAVTLFALQNGVDVNDARALEAIARKVEIELKGHQVFLNGEDVSEAIRTPEVTKAVSPVSAHAGVRKAMVFRQRQMGEQGKIVAEGRDTTSVVFPDADFKIYLVASLDARAQRRMLEYAKKGNSTTLDEQKELLATRDNIDSNRDNSPLTRTPDSILLDTSSLTIEEQVDRILKIVLASVKGL